MRGGQRGDRVGSQIMWGLEGPYRGSGSDGQHERFEKRGDDLCLNRIILAAVLKTA